VEGSAVAGEAAGAATAPPEVLARKQQPRTSCSPARETVFRTHSFNGLLANHADTVLKDEMKRFAATYQSGHALTELTIAESQKAALDHKYNYAVQKSA
jgi:hypothetical protein